MSGSNRIFLEEALRSIGEKSVELQQRMAELKEKEAKSQSLNERLHWVKEKEKTMIELTATVSLLKRTMENSWCEK